MLSASELRENGYLDDNSVNGSVMEAGIKDSGPDYFKTCRTRWVLRDLEAQVTRVELSVEVEWVHGVMAAVTGGVVEGVAEGMIAAFEWRAGRVLG